MTVKPIPLTLLSDTITLLQPTEAGYAETEISNVRVVCRSEVSDYDRLRARDKATLTIYYDCANSSPSGVEFAAGMTILHDGKRYELIIAEEFRAEQPHHIRIKARMI